MKSCPECNASNEDGARFCYSCGASLEPKQAEQPVAPPQPEQPAQPAPPPPVYDQPIQLSSTPKVESAPAGSAPEGPAPKNPAQLWLILNIVSLVVCCCTNLIFSVIGIVMGAMGTSAFNKGDIEEAEKKAKTSKIMFFVSLGVGLVLDIISIICYFAIFASSLSSYY